MAHRAYPTFLGQKVDFSTKIRQVRQTKVQKLYALKTFPGSRNVQKTPFWGTPFLGGLDPLRYL
jgi:hypothetical protein